MPNLPLTPVGYANSHVGCELGFRGSVAWYGWRLCRPACGGHPGCYLDSPTSRCAAPSDRSQARALGSIDEACSQVKTVPDNLYEMAEVFFS